MSKVVTTRTTYKLIGPHSMNSGKKILKEPLMKLKGLCNQCLFQSSFNSKEEHEITTLRIACFSRRGGGHNSIRQIVDFDFRRASTFK